MDVKDLLKVIQVQRHDFLNHLQVISGFVQLGKADRVKGYIERVCRDLQLMSVISRIKVPEIVAAIMIGHNLAAEHQVEIEYQLKTDLGEIAVPGEILGRVLLEMQKKMFKAFLPQADQRKMIYIIEEFKGEYICSISAENLARDFKYSLEELIQKVEKKLGLDRARVEIINFDGTFNVSLISPVGKYVNQYIG